MVPAGGVAGPDPLARPDRHASAILSPGAFAFSTESAKHVRNHHPLRHIHRQPNSMPTLEEALSLSLSHWQTRQAVACRP